MSNVCEIIPTLSTTEKLAAMEALWTSLHEKFEGDDSPEWHGRILDERMNLIKSGEAVYQDWDRVKSELRTRMT